MNKFRALRIVALVYRIVAWVVLVLGIVSAIGLIVLSVIQGRMGAPSSILEALLPIPVPGGLLGGIIGGVVTIVLTLLYFVFIYAVSDVVHLGLAIEENTRQTATFLRGEAIVPSPPKPESWETPSEREETL